MLYWINFLKPSWVIIMFNCQINCFYNRRITTTYILIPDNIISPCTRTLLLTLIYLKVSTITITKGAKYAVIKRNQIKTPCVFPLFQSGSHSYPYPISRQNLPCKSRLFKILFKLYKISGSGPLLEGPFPILLCIHLWRLAATSKRYIFRFNWQIIWIQLVYARVNLALNSLLFCWSVIYLSVLVGSACLVLCFVEGDLCIYCIYIAFYAAFYNEYWVTKFSNLQ